MRLVFAAILLGLGLGACSAAPAQAQLTPEQFGAAGDGRSDDSAAFDRALASLKASRGGALTGRPGARYRITRGIMLRGISNVRLAGNGATIFRETPGTAANALTLAASSNIVIEGWSFDSSYNGFERGSTGSNANIFLAPDAAGVNRGIVIRGNSFNNGNIANIMIGTTGIDSILPEQAFANEDIRIENNQMGNAGVGVFVYKGTRRFAIVGNEGANFSISAIGVDTHAASDPDRRNYRIEDGEIRSNTFRTVRAAPVPWNPGQAFAARGIVLKGGIHDVVVADNRISAIRSITNVDTFGFLVVKDQALQNAGGSGLTIVNNTIEDVGSVAPGATAAWAMVLGPGYSEVVIKGNVFKDSERGVKLSAGSSWSFLLNRLESLSLSASSPLHIDASSTFAGPKTVEGNSFVRGRGRSVQAIDAVEGMANLSVGRNELVGYPVRPR